jgi:uncharacterized protein YwgA
LATARQLAVCAAKGLISPVCHRIDRFSIYVLSRLKYNFDELEYTILYQLLRLNSVMNRSEIVLAALAASDGALHTPVQVQKLFFLIDKKVAEYIGGPFFNFHPDDYGPFDKMVYVELEQLTEQGSVEIIHNGMRRFRLTIQGQQHGDTLLSSIGEPVADYLRSLSRWVRSVSFADLVSAIYKEYPDMRANSIFRNY